MFAAYHYCFICFFLFISHAFVLILPNCIFIWLTIPLECFLSVTINALKMVCEEFKYRNIARNKDDRLKLSCRAFYWICHHCCTEFPGAPDTRYRICYPSGYYWCVSECYSLFGRGNRSGIVHGYSFGYKITRIYALRHCTLYYHTTNWQ